MSRAPDSRSTVQAGSAAILRRWDALKVSHPEVAEVLKPLLHRIWRRLIRRRPDLWELREGRGFGPERSRPVGVGISHGQVDKGVHVEDAANSVACRVEYAFLVPETGVFLVGWIFDAHGIIESMTVSAGAASSTIAPRDMIRLNRTDVLDAYRAWPGSRDDGRLGFACLVRLDGVTDYEMVSMLEVTFTDGASKTWHLTPRPVIRDSGDPLAVIRDVLTLVPPREPEMLDHHLGPAVSALWEQVDHRERIVDVGETPAAPNVSLVVPIYGRYDFIEYQMALFAGDPDIREAELIYVIDDPRIVDEAVRLCREIYPIFGVPCRLVLAEQNNGFAKATNIGAAIARAPLLLLLNSDVMPRGHGWLGEMTRAYAALPSPGALGPRLLFPDGSLQHGGMDFVQEPWFPGIWLNDHPGKGLPPPAASHLVERVPAITAACMMVATEAYHGLGGLDEGYPVGDFEDSDFCLKLQQLGHGSWVAPWIELVHLERQSQQLDGDLDWRQSLTLYNAWRHTRKWDQLIAPDQDVPVHAGNGASRA